MKNLKISYLLDVYGPVLTDKQRDVVELYYCEDLSLAEIAEICGITRQGVRDSIKRGEAVILELEEKLGLVKRFQEIYAAADEIKAVVRDLAAYNNRQVYSEQIKLFSEAILDKLSLIDEE